MKWPTKNRCTTGALILKFWISAKSGPLVSSLLDTKKVCPQTLFKSALHLDKKRKGQPKTTYKERPEKGQKSSNPRTFLVAPLSQDVIMTLMQCLN